jgi:predicted enzyme related to lactoylglutathione lyase
MPKFVHIDIAADDPRRAVDFFSKVFGWSARKLEGPVPYWLLSTSLSSKDELACFIRRSLGCDSKDGDEAVGFA